MATASSSQENKTDSPTAGSGTNSIGKNSHEQISSTSIDEIKEFVRVGRTGRRNAIADVSLDPNASAMSANSLAELMCKIDCSGTKENQTVNN